jgi:5-methylcytosine-specific restriction endonuclease McrA
LGGKSLVLNRSYLPVHVTTVRRAFSLLYRGVARAVDENYRTFDFADWTSVSALDSEAVGLVSGLVRVPRVILLVSFDRVPRREVRFSRHNIFMRDGSACQYCGDRKARSELNLDHVIPRSRGGESVWENVVTACAPCNLRKGNRLLEESGLTLHRQPRPPAPVLFIHLATPTIPSVWQRYLPGGATAAA